MAPWEAIQSNHQSPCFNLLIQFTIILPAKNEAGNLPLLVEEIGTVFPATVDYEIIVVDDGSVDGPDIVFAELCAKFSNLKFKRFHLFMRCIQRHGGSSIIHPA